MNKFTMFIWGLLIFALWGVILLIAYKQRDTDYIEINNELKKVSEKYVSDKKIKIKFNESSKIYIKDLLEEEYIEEDKRIDDYCIDSVIVHKGLFGLDYQLYTDSYYLNYQKQLYLLLQFS